MEIELGFGIEDAYKSSHAVEILQIDSSDLALLIDFTTILIIQAVT